MASKVEQEVVVRIKTIVDGLNEVKTLSDTIKGFGKGKSFTGDFVKGGIAAGAMNAVVNKLISGLEEVGRVGVGAIGSFVEEGIRFNATIESARIGIATLVANTYDVRDANGTLLDPIHSFNAALEKSDELERALQKSAIETKFEFADILTFFNSTVIASAGLKTNLEQLVRLTQDFSLAAGAANIDVEKVSTGIQQILTGNTTVRNQLARVIFPGLGTKEINEQLRKYKEAGTLVDFLEKKMEVFKLSADVVGQSFEAVGSNAKDAFKVFEAIATLPLFDRLKVALGFIITQIVDLSGDAVKLTPTFQKIADIIGLILGFLGDRMIEYVKVIFAYIGAWADALSSNLDAVEKIVVSIFVIAEQLVGIAASIFGIVGDVANANNSTQGWVQTLQYVAIWLGAVRDVLNIIIGSIEIAAGLITQGVGAGIKLVGDGLQWIVDKTSAWVSGLGYAANILSSLGASILGGGTNFTNGGLDRFVSGFNGDATGNALNRQSLQFPGTGAKPKKSNFSFTPRTGLNQNADGGAKDRKRKENERIKDAQRLYNELEKYQIANSERGVQIAAEANKAILALEQLRYDKGLTSAEEFYKRKAELENTDLDSQEAALKQQSKFAERALNRDLGAIAGKFDLNESEVSAIIDKLKDLSPSDIATADPVTIKQATEYVKYLEQTAGITQKLNLIEFKRKEILADTTEATAKQTRANKGMLDGLAAEFGQSTGNDGLTELNNLQKRVADEFPKILTETNKTLPGIKQFATEIYDAAHVDASALPQLLEDSGIKFDDLSEEARLFIKLMERLQDLAKIKGIGSQVDRAQNAFKASSDGTQSDFDNGKINLSTALAQNTDAKAVAVKALTAAYVAQKDVLADLQSKGIATPEDVQNVENLRRAIEGLTSDLDKLALINAQADRNNTRISTAMDSIELRRGAGDISSKRAKEETLALQRQQIEALQGELNALQALDQTNIQVQQRIAETQNKLAEVRNATNADFVNFAQGINGTIADSFSTFLDSIQSGTESIGDAFRQLLASLLLGIAKAIAQALLLKFILAPLGLTGGDSGGIGCALCCLLFGKKADGGIISGSGTGVSDTAGIFALSHGEGVIPADRVRQYGSGLISSIINGSFLPRISIAGFAGGGFPAGVEGGRGGTRIINTVDPNLVADFMSSAQGEEIIVNVIGKNPGLVQRLA